MPSIQEELNVPSWEDSTLPVAPLPGMDQQRWAQQIPEQGMDQNQFRNFLVNLAKAQEEAERSIAAASSPTYIVHPDDSPAPLRRAAPTLVTPVQAAPRLPPLPQHFSPLRQPPPLPPLPPIHAPTPRHPLPPLPPIQPRMIPTGPSVEASIPHVRPLGRRGNQVVPFVRDRYVRQ